MKRQTLWRCELGLELQGGCVGLVAGGPWVFACARPTPTRAAVIALDSRGRERWRIPLGDPDLECYSSVMPHFLPLAGSPAVAHGWSRCSADRQSGRRGIALVDAATGSPRWAWEDEGCFGLNRDLQLVDLDGDGLPEVLAGPHDCLISLEAATGRERWRYDEGVTICWGRSAVSDLNGDGRPEIVFGTEWGNADGSSAMIALTADGRELWRHDGLPGDFGSTPAYAVDVNGDGIPEVVHAELDLEGRVGLPRSRVWVFSAAGEALATLPFGGSDMVVGDWDGDGHVEAVGPTVRRDGGYANAPEIVCLDLTAGDVKWRRPMDRWWLGTWPVLADLDGDGVAELVAGAGNPNGYGKLPDQDPWGDLYLLRPDGSLFDLITRDDAWSLCQVPVIYDGHPALVILWDDGRVEAAAW